MPARSLSPLFSDSRSSRRLPATKRAFVALQAIVFVVGSVALVAAPALRPSPAAAAPRPAQQLTPDDLIGEIERGPATISQDVVDEFDDGSETVEAVVTTWTYDEIADVRALGIQGTQLHVLPMLLVPELTREQLDELAQSPAVRSVYPNRRYQVSMEDSTWITGARYVWGPSAQGDLNVTGAGVQIAEIDTGIDGRHADADNLVEYCETTLAVGSDSAEVFCSPFNPETDNAGPAGPSNNARLDSTDDDGHGTHVMGTIAGTGDASGGMEEIHSTIGVAPEASTHVYSANIGLFLALFQILASYDDMTAKKLGYLNGDLPEMYNIMATSNSYGGGEGSNYDPEDAQHIAINAAYTAGILSVFAAGNDGPEHDTLSDQCVNPRVVCVAASTKPDSVVMFSSRGRPSEPADTNRNGIIHQPGTEPTIADGPDEDKDPDPNPNYDPGDVPPDNHDRALGIEYELGLYRPALTAPGVNIGSMNQEASATGRCIEGGAVQLDCYVYFNGTSMATPHVSGAVALIVQAYRDAHGGADPTPAQITDILERSANVS